VFKGRDERQVRIMVVLYARALLWDVVDGVVTKRLALSLATPGGVDTPRCAGTLAGWCRMGEYACDEHIHWLVALKGPPQVPVLCERAAEGDWRRRRRLLLHHAKAAKGGDGGGGEHAMLPCNHPNLSNLGPNPGVVACKRDLGPEHRA
jgi:hypothetical protein